MELARKLDAAEGVLGEASVAAPGKSRRGGRPRDHDPKQDARIYDGWKSGLFRIYAEYALERNLTEREVRRAVDRQRKQRARKNPPVK